MPSFELNRLQSITGVGAVAGADRTRTKTAPEAGSPTSAQASSAASGVAGVAIEINSRLETSPPVDADRAEEIRSALRNGTYPLVPAKIADAMIAAQLSFEVRT